MPNQSDQWTLACHLEHEDGASVRILTHRGGRTSVHAVPGVEAEGGAAPVYLGASRDRQVFLLDRATGSVRSADALPQDALGLYGYPEPDTARIWYTHDGDLATGNDTAMCGDRGASMTVVEAAADGALPKVLRTICVGRGHHVPTFPEGARRVYISNLLDGTVSVVSNDPGSPTDHLDVIGVINLCEPAREQDGTLKVPNGAYPHGQVYSRMTGRIYGLNNGYGTIAVIDPGADRIDDRIAFPGCSNLLISSNGRYIIGKGADRRSDPDHVMGRLLVLDLESGGLQAADLPDIYPSTYRFNAEGTRFYVTTAATGKGAQRDHLRIDQVLVYDATALPALRPLDVIEVGRADCGRRPIGFLAEGGRTHRIFIPNPSDGTMMVLDGASHEHLETIELGVTDPIVELNFSFLGAGNFYGS